MKGRQWKSMRSCFKTLILTIWQHIISGKGKQGGTNFLMVKLEALQWTIQSKMYRKEEQVVTVRSSRHTAQEEPSHPLPLKKARFRFQFCFCTPCQGSQSIGSKVHTKPYWKLQKYEWDYILKWVYSSWSGQTEIS